MTLDSDYADRNVLTAPARLPLRFHSEMHDATGAGVELAARDQYELVRAFLLGAKLPLSVDLIDDGPRQRLSLQLASRYSFDCGELIDPSTQPVCKDICVIVSEAIFVRSHHFFADPQNGLAVWHLRAAQELFGDPRPAPETFWPIAEGEAAAQNPFIVPPAPQAARAKPRTRRYAIAASVLVGLLGPAVLLTGFGFRGEPSARAAIEEEPVTLSVAMQPQAQPQSVVQPVEPVAPEIQKAVEPVEERRIETASLAMASDAPRAILPVMMISPLNAIPPQLLAACEARQHLVRP